MATCIEWAYERTEECNAWADQGYNDCTSFRAQCCTWWPCSWACEAVSWVCTAFVWVTQMVCVGWTWITTSVCVAWDVVTMMASAFLVVFEFFVGGVVSVFAAAVELLQAIPVIGPLIRWVINAITFVYWIVQSIPDALLGIAGVRPEKKLRVCTIIMQDMSGNRMATTPDVIAMLQMACDVYKRDANIRIIPHWPLQISSGFAGPETVTKEWIINDPYGTGEDVLTQPCSASGVAGEWWTVGTIFQIRTTRLCFTGAARRVLGYGAPIAVFIIRNLAGGVGCSFVITDYVTIDGVASDPANPLYSPRTIGHELGHACNLSHACVNDDNLNMMATADGCWFTTATAVADRTNPRISNVQTILLRASKHVTYF